MAGYFIYSLDLGTFEQLTTQPTKDQGLAFADEFLEHIDDYAEYYGWPVDRDHLADFIMGQLSSEIWYSRAKGDDIHEDIVHSLQHKPGKTIGIDFQCENLTDALLYWDAAELACEHGATKLESSVFGKGGYRNAELHSETPIYRIYMPEDAQELLRELGTVEQHFTSHPDEETRAQFFEGLLEPVQRVVSAGRVLWVQTDY